MEDWEYGMILDYSTEFSSEIKWGDISYFPSQKSVFENLYSIIEGRNTPLDFQLKPFILISGPSLSGKSTLVKAFANQYSFKLFIVSPSKLVGETFAETVQKIVNVFQLMKQEVDPFMIHFDNFEFIAWERLDPSERGEYKRLTSVFLSELTDILRTERKFILSAETSKPEVLDTSIRSRFIQVQISLSEREVRKVVWNNYYDLVKKSINSVSWDINTLVSASEGYEIGHIEQIVMLAALEYERTHLERLTTDLVIKQMESVHRPVTNLSTVDIDLQELGKLLEPYYRQGG